MKILHTSDWHLGQKLLFNDRHQEQAAALEWLLQTIEEQTIEVLLVSGDIFDTGNPPNQARQLYYNFLRQLLRSNCRHVIITGGNHDSPAMLNAPGELLKSLNIHVIGAASDNIEDELICLENEKGEVELVVAAVPFLRDRDLRYVVSGESETDRKTRLQQGLTAHYQTLADLAAPYKAKGIPVFAMGHLFAKGAETSGKQDNIYVGNLENMEASQFPDSFDYVALGHIHRAQKVGGDERIRYSGSLIPLSFSETKDEKIVLILTLEKGQIKETTAFPVPTYRRLKTIEGKLEEVQEKLDRFAQNKERQMRPWVEVLVELEEYLPQLDQLLQDYVKDMELDLVKIRIKRNYESLAAQREDIPDLDELEVEEVFLRKCDSSGEMPAEQKEELRTTFKELINWMNEQEVE